MGSVILTILGVAAVAFLAPNNSILQAVAVLGGPFLVVFVFAIWIARLYKSERDAWFNRK